MSRKVIRVHAGDPPSPPVGRGTRSTALALPGLPAPRVNAVDIVHDDGDDAIDDGGAASRAGGIVVDEEVVRGADRLAARRAGGGEQFKMMSFGRRNPALSRAEFAARWRDEAGRLGGERIPDDVRGVAYVQDHPVGDDPPFDAINEVWFDDLDGLRRRAEWFAARPVPPELFAPDECWSVYLVEVPLDPT